MKRETLSMDEFDRHDKAMKATIVRIQAENTWLRHNYGELEARVAALRADITALRKAAAGLKKSLETTAKKELKTRSRK
ncbi:MAG: hypothetical protein ACOY6N_11625 [Pseudomonadota bacterium]